VVSFKPRPLYPQGKSPQYPLDRRWTPESLWTLRREKLSLIGDMKKEDDDYIFFFFCGTTTNAVQRPPVFRDSEYCTDIGQYSLDEA
jgi:hypothetical protein